MTAKLKEKPKPRDLQVAEAVLRQEAEALNVLAESLNGDFLKAVDTIYKTKGRVIVTGMGKSGHVARKIAATLASTGTPAFFVHPGEASHGDLGMIERKDCVLALSYSGKAAELRDVIGYTARFEIPLIAMTGNPASPLAEAATILLLLPKLAEAGSLGLAPTTSTTMQMALGDALAVALFERRGFTPEDFKVFHPGGALGKHLLRVKDLMHTGVAIPLIDARADMSKALIGMSAGGFGCVGVIDDDGNLLGIITDGDLRRHMSRDLTAQPVAQVMTPNPRTIRPGALAAECLAEMTLHKPQITNIFVVEEGRPVGIIHMHDLLRAGVT